MRDIDIPLKPSKHFIALLTIAMGGSFYALFCCSSLLGWVKFLLVLLVGGYGIYIFRRYGSLQDGKSIVSVRLLANGTWMLFTKEKVIAGELSGDSTLTRPLMVLRFTSLGYRWKRTCILFQDSMDPAVYRELLVQLRCQVN